MAEAAKGERPAHVFALMDRLGMNRCPGALARWSLDLGIALRRCEACDSKAACRQWLDRAPQMVNCPPRFCRNADLLIQIMCAQPGPRQAD